MSLRKFFKKFWSQKDLNEKWRSKTIWSIKIFVQQIFWSKTICSNENFGLKTYFGEEKRFGVQKTLEYTKNVCLIFCFSINRDILLNCCRDKFCYQDKCLQTISQIIPNQPILKVKLSYAYKIELPVGYFKFIVWATLATTSISFPVVHIVASRWSLIWIKLVGELGLQSKWKQAERRTCTIQIIESNNPQKGFAGNCKYWNKNNNKLGLSCAKLSTA